MKVLDPFSSVKLLLDRNNQYRIVKNVLDALDERISVPPFVRLDAAEPDANVETVKALRLRYPLGKGLLGNQLFFFPNYID